MLLVALTILVILSRYEFDDQFFMIAQL